MNIQTMPGPEFIQLYLGSIAIAAAVFAIGFSAYFLFQVLVAEVEARRFYAQYQKPMLKPKSNGPAGHNGERAR